MPQCPWVRMKLLPLRLRLHLQAQVLRAAPSPPEEASLTGARPRAAAASRQMIDRRMLIAAAAAMAAAQPCEASPQANSNSVLRLRQCPLH
mmetsp:Transcript_49089/g.110434  ORF Transcript_49089/g.110434 Transcript_49089/m.110434 type:complete len:91 (-) Transcript_49089:1461-1733(-)